MGSNNLRQLKKDLKAFAKRVKDFKYTDSALITFLLTGIITLGISNVTFSAEDAIATQTRQISSSIKDMRLQFKKARNKNDKLLRDTNLELIQLMEQGDHVVKSPWSSWQYGMNYFNNNWNGTYKGRGDKKEKYPYEGRFERSKNSFERYTSPLSSHYGDLSLGANRRSASSNLRNGIPSSYGIASNDPAQEPIVEMNVEASIRPKTVNIEIPDLGIRAPQLNALGVPNLLPPSLDIPEPNTPNIVVNLPTPNTNPFSDFCFTCGTQNGKHQTDNSKSFSDSQHNKADGNDPDKTPNWADGGMNKFWTGYNPTTGVLTQNSGINGNIRNFTYQAGSKEVYLPRTAAALYFNKSTDPRVSTGGVVNPNAKNIYPQVGFEAKNFEVYVAGNVHDDTGNAGITNGGHNGAIGIHTVWDGSLTNVKGHLYGKADFLSIETWHSGNVKFSGVNVKIERDESKHRDADENTIFFIYPATYETIASHNYWTGAPKQRGGFIGKVDAEITSRKNAVYSVLGAQGSFEIDSTGTYKLEGGDNIVYSGLGYSPNFQNLIGSGIVQDLFSKGMTPSIKLSIAPESYGDGNVIMLFNNRIDLTGKAFYDSPTDPNNKYTYSTDAPATKNDRADRWRRSGVGIYQGEIKATGIIGNKRNIDDNGNQTNAGNTVGDPAYVENNIGIYARSGQRGPQQIGATNAKIIPSQDLGATDTARSTKFDLDEIHSLQINDIDINFGKYSKNGIMMVSENGTVMDVAMGTNKHNTSDSTTVPVMTGDIKDYVGSTGLNGQISYNDANNMAATGTIIAYSSGTWKNSIHDMRSNEAQAFEGQPSEINIGRNVILSGRYKDFGTGASKTYSYPIAYVAKEGGVVNNKAGTTIAKGYGSIIALADGTGSTVNITNKITAKDEWAAHDAETKPYLYTNIGAYAAAGGTVNAGEHDIYGIGAMAKGTGAIVNLSGTKAGSTIETGKDGALVALGGGTVNYGGGTIIHREHESKDHDTSTPFTADSSSRINFTGDTLLKISNGILMPGTGADYEGTTPVATAKYHGMQNVDVELIGDGVILSSNDNHPDFHWTGGTIGNLVQNNMKVRSFNDGGHSYKIYYINGNFFIDTNADLDSPTDVFNKFGLAREKVTVSPGVTVASATGKGLAMGSNKNATSNMDSGYTNKGTINITGGTPTGTTAINTSYGYLDNQSAINMDSGIAAYGVNGSKFTNNSTGTINITNGGVGMAAFASATSGLQAYGTDAKVLTATDKVLELDNKGTITIGGNQSIGLYGETNDIAGRGLVASNGSITNTGKITMTGDAAVGILAKRATVNLGGTGSSDITVGTNGIGVYAESSPVNIVSNTGIEVKDKGVGIFVKNDGSTLTGSALEIKYTGSANNSAAGIFYEGGAGHNVTNTTDVNIVNSGSNKGIVGVYMNNGGTLTNAATITDKSGKAYGIYSEGADVVNNGTLNIGNKGKGILSTGGNVRLTSSSVINLGEDEAIGVYTKGTGNNITADAGSTMAIGNGSYGFINEGTGNTITSNMTSQSVGDNTVFVFSRDASGTVINNTPLTSTGSLNYGLYSAGNVVNNADINYSSGIGNVGIYSINGGSAVNNPGVSITVGASNSDPTANQYAIGMAAGYVGDATTPAYTGNIENKGIINVVGPYSIGMYGVNRGTRVVNSGIINLNSSNTTGMYLDNGAEGINNGIIKSNGTGLKKVVGVVVKNGSTIENNGTIDINADEAVGLLSKGNAAGQNPGIIKNYGTLTIRGAGSVNTQIPQPGHEISKDMAGIKIHAPSGSSTATITVNGVPVVPEVATTTGEEYKPMEVSTIGMYIDTSNKRFTRPIVGLSNLSTLKNADLIIGTEAAQNTTSKYIQLSPQILAPYNQMILNNPQIGKWNIYSGSLTWMSSVAQNQTDGTIENAYLAKIPYTKWAGNQNTPVNSTDTYNFLDGLEQRYGVEGLGTREKTLFNKLNGIGNNEEILFYQATDEMMGHQYGNLQQRINATGNLLDKEFRYLKHDWRNSSKQNNKIKVFGQRDEYNTDTAGVIDYTSNAYGVAYVHEDETVKMGNSQGWYAGAVTNRFKFKDIGHSRENQTQIKAGIFKTMSPSKDHNGSLQWTIGGDVFFGINDMKRRYLVVDDIFQAKSDYHSYGAALKTDLGYDIRLSERTHLRPYGALKMEYGRFSKIKEDSGEMRLEVKGNSYFSVKPEAGLEFKYIQPMAVKTNLSVGLTAAYENELGKMASKNNEGRVRYTDADWFGIRGDKEDRKGNGKFDLNIGVDNTRFGVTVNAGYDTKGKNVRSGVGFRLIY